MPNEKKPISKVHATLAILVILVVVVGIFEYLYLRASGNPIGFDDIQEVTMQKRAKEAAALTNGCPVADRLVFSASITEELNTSDIYIACLSTGALFNITNNQNANFVPQLSPDGKTVYYYAPRNDNPEFNDWEIWAADITGENQRRLSDNPRADTFPALSPDGTKLAFISNNSEGEWRLHVMNTDGTNEVSLPSFKAFNATFASNNSIVFTQQSDKEQQELFEYDLSSEEVTQLTDDGIQKSAPAVSSDGTYVLFDTKITGSFEVYRMDIDSGDITQLTQTAGDSGTASFSYDGNKVVFSSDRGGSAEIYSMTVNGTNQQPLITGLGLNNARNPSFAAPGN